MANASSSSSAVPRLLVYAHLGDLQVTDAKACNYQELRSILAQLEAEGASQLDFSCLPGQVANSSLTVEAQDATGRHQLLLAIGLGSLPAVAPAGRGQRRGRGGAWGANGILGTQLGPNRNARPLKPS